jgi:hypothetical protein
MTPHSPPPTEATAAPRRDERPDLANELFEAAKQAYGALVGAHAKDDSVQGQARLRLRAVLQQLGFIGNTPFDYSALNAYATAPASARAASIPCDALPGHDMLVGPCCCGAWHQGEHAIAALKARAAGEDEAWEGIAADLLATINEMLSNCSCCEDAGPCANCERGEDAIDKAGEAARRLAAAGAAKTGGK